MLPPTLATRHFSRAIPFQPSSTHLSVFGSLHTEINRTFWATTAAFRFTDRELEKNAALGNPPQTVLSSVLARDNDFSRNISAWQQCSNDSLTWLRLSIATAIASHFEVYLFGAIKSSIESDPGSIWRCAQKIDGVLFLKHSAKYDFSEDVKQCVEGTWQKRSSEMGKLFKGVPPLLTNSIGMLEKLRELRNGAAHKLGRDMKHEFALGELPQALKPPSNITHSEILEYLKKINKLARAIDTHLLASHIGAYEIVRLFHFWRSHNAVATGKYASNAALQFRKYVAERWGWLIGTEYSRELIAYYEGV